MAGRKPIECCITLKPSITFNPITDPNNVFFDYLNKQIIRFEEADRGLTFSITNDGDKCQTFNIPGDSRITSIRLSTDNSIMGILRNSNCVEFFNIGNNDYEPYTQVCKGKLNQVLGFIWTSSTEILYITTNGLELYQLTIEKKYLRLARNIAVIIKWFIWQPDSNILLIATGRDGTVMQPFQIRSQLLLGKLRKFEVEINRPAVDSSSKRSTSAAPTANNSFIVTLYDHVYACFVLPDTKSTGTIVTLYQLSQLHLNFTDSEAVRSYYLTVNAVGDIRISTVDNLLLVHHTTAATTLIFDISTDHKITSDKIGIVDPCLPVQSIPPITIKAPENHSKKSEDVDISIYNSNFCICPPNSLICAVHGCVFLLDIKLKPVHQMITDKSRLVSFLFNRKNGKEWIFRVCRNMLTPGKQCYVQDFRSIFYRMNLVYKDYSQQLSITQNERINLTSPTKFMAPFSIDQNEFYSRVLSIFTEREDISHKFIMSVLIEYIHTLDEFEIPIQHFIYELIVNSLVRSKCFFQLHQFIQYHVIADSKPIACLLLSLEAYYPPAFQLALDMLMRLQTANEEILEVLISKKFIFKALKFLRTIGEFENAPAGKYLEAALDLKSPVTFYHVFKTFETRNRRLRGDSRFLVDDCCEQYVRKFIQMFGSDSMDHSPATIKSNLSSGHHNGPT